jgi:hypothetical protein
MTSLTMPLINVSVAFNNDPFEASPTFTDITKYVLGFTTTMGRQHELQQVQPSTCQITLTNDALPADLGGRFSSWNTASPFHHSGAGFIPTRPVKITATWPRVGGTTYPVFYGYSRQWIPNYGATRSTVTLDCYDILALLNMNTLDTGQYAKFIKANAFAYFPLSDAVGSGTAVDIQGGAAGTLGGLITFGVPGPLLTETATAATSANGFISVPTTISGTSVSIEGWIKATNTGDYNYLFISSSGITHLKTDITTGNAVAIFSNQPVTGTTNVVDGTWHYLVGTFDGTNARVYVDGLLQATAAASTTVAATTASIASATSTATFAQVAVYNSVLTPGQVNSQFQIGSATWVVQDSGARISAVLGVAGVPSALNNVGAGTAFCQGATSSLATTTAMSYVNTILNTERGFLFQDTSGVIQFRNRHYVYENASSNTSQATFGTTTGGGVLHYFSSGIVPAADDLDLFNNFPVNRQGGLVQTVADTASQTRHGRRTLTGMTSLLFISDADSLDLAQGLAFQYSTAATRVRALTVDSTIDAGAGLPQMLGRKLMDRVTINWKPLDGSSAQFTQQSLIEHVSHTVTPEVWSTTFAVTPIGTEPFFILDSATQGVLDTNKLGF